MARLGFSADENDPASLHALVQQERQRISELTAQIQQEQRKVRAAIASALSFMLIACAFPGVFACFVRRSTD